MEKTAIILCIIHLVYYTYFQIVSDFMRIGMVTNTPHIEIRRLITQYKVNIRTFQKNGKPFGFAWVKTIYLNENLTKKIYKKGGYEKLNWVFHHEHYHVMKNHKIKTLLLRFVFSFVPLLLIWHWVPFLITYLSFAYLMDYTHRLYEKKANDYANNKFEKKS